MSINGIWLSNRKDRPSWRIACVLRRLSRNTWLAPDEVSALGFKLAKLCAPSAWSAVLRAAYRPECEVVGMIRGEPPAYIFEDHFNEVRRAVIANLPKGREAVMIAIIKTARQL